MEKTSNLKDKTQIIVLEQYIKKFVKLDSLKTLNNIDFSFYFHKLESGKRTHLLGGKTC